MYNEELKTRFVREYTTEIKTAENFEILFNVLEPYERKWDADICTRSAEELEPVLDEICGLRAQSRITRMALLIPYIRWCLNNGVEGACDGIFHVSNVGVGRFRTNMVSNPLQLQTYMNCVLDPEDENTMDNVYRSLYWLAFSGIKEQECTKVQVEDVDLLNMVIRFKGVEYPIYQEGMKAIRKCAELESFVYKHPMYAKDIIRPRTDGNALLRGIKANVSARNLGNVIAKKMSNANDAEVAKVKLSYSRVSLSGIFYRKYEMERAGIPIDFEPEARALMKGKFYKLDLSGSTQDVKKREFMRNYMTDYIHWKEAFSI